MDTKKQRELIGNAVNQAGPEQVEGICVGWILVAEWIDDEGKRWLTRFDSNASYDALPAWTRAGYLQDALYGKGWDEEQEE